MIRAMFSAATGMIAQQTNIDTIAHNMANVNTTGFKKRRVNFQYLLYETIKAPGGQTASGTTIPEGIQIGHGVRPSSVSKLFTPGSFIATGNEFDIAIEGDGFFQTVNLQKNLTLKVLPVGCFHIFSSEGCFFKLEQKERANYSHC